MVLESHGITVDTKLIPWISMDICDLPALDWYMNILNIHDT
jgi:hypothetical protein